MQCRNARWRNFMERALETNARIARTILRWASPRSNFLAASKPISFPSSTWFRPERTGPLRAADSLGALRFCRPPFAARRRALRSDDVTGWQSRRRSIALTEHGADLRGNPGAAIDDEERGRCTADTRPATETRAPSSIIHLKATCPRTPFLRFRRVARGRSRRPLRDQLVAGRRAPGRQPRPSSATTTNRRRPRSAWKAARRLPFTPEDRACSRCLRQGRPRPTAHEHEDRRAGSRQSEAPDGLGQPRRSKKAEVTLPGRDVAMNAAAADGPRTAAAESADRARDADSEAHCPESSKIGSAEVEHPGCSTNGLEAARSTWPSRTNNPFGSLLAGYLVAEGSGPGDHDQAGRARPRLSDPADRARLSVDLRERPPAAALESDRPR